MIAIVRQLLGGWLIAAMVMAGGAPVVLAHAKGAAVTATQASEDCAKHHAPVQPADHASHTLAQCLESCLDQADTRAIMANGSAIDNPERLAPVAPAAWLAIHTHAALATARMPTGPPGGYAIVTARLIHSARSGAAAILVANHRHRI